MNVAIWRIFHVKFQSRNWLFVNLFLNLFGHLYDFFKLQFHMKSSSNCNIHKLNSTKPSQFDELFSNYNSTWKFRQIATFLHWLLWTQFSHISPMSLDCIFAQWIKGREAIKTKEAFNQFWLSWFQTWKENFQRSLLHHHSRAVVVLWNLRHMQNTK